MVRRPLQPPVALLAALGGIGLLVLVWVLAFRVAGAGRVDLAILGGFTGLRGSASEPVASAIAHLADPQPFVLFGIVAIAVALLRRRPRVALAIAALLVGANVTTELLKPALAHVRDQGDGTASAVSAAAWPSGHATAAMSLALAAVLAAPARVRAVVAAVGAAVTVAVSFSLLALGWHFPSDVLGGYLVAAVWALLVVAAVRLADDRRPVSRAVAAPGASVRGALGPALATLGLAAAIVVIVALVHPSAFAGYAREHTAFVVGAAVLGALALSLATGLALVLGAPRGREPAPGG